jgi:hypothetical protein
MRIPVVAVDYMVAEAKAAIEAVANSRPCKPQSRLTSKPIRLCEKRGLRAAFFIAGRISDALGYSTNVRWVTTAAQPSSGLQLLATVLPCVLAFLLGAGPLHFGRVHSSRKREGSQMTRFRRPACACRTR